MQSSFAEKISIFTLIKRLIITYNKWERKNLESAKQNRNILRSEFHQV